MNENTSKTVRIVTILGVIVTVLLFIAYMYYIRTDRTQFVFHWIRNLGIWGIGISILVLAVLCVLPVPSEFIIVMNMEIFGVGWGIFYSWIGGILGAVAALYSSKWMARPLIESIAGRYLEPVNEWLRPRRTSGLLIVRLMPLLPYHLVNYIAGILDVKLWAFTWTTAVGLIPFDAAMAGMFSGFRHGKLLAGVLGCLFIAVLFVLGMVVRKRNPLSIK